MESKRTSLLACSTRAKVRSECKPHKKQYMEVVLVCGVFVYTGVTGGMVSIKRLVEFMPPLPALTELLLGE